MHTIHMYTHTHTHTHDKASTHICKQSHQEHMHTHTNTHLYVAGQECVYLLGDGAEGGPAGLGRVGQRHC